MTDVVGPILTGMFAGFGSAIGTHMAQKHVIKRGGRVLDRLRKARR
jgi:hypothetical protein